MKGAVYINDELAGILEKDTAGKYHFRYEDAYFQDPLKPSISLTLPQISKAFYYVLETVSGFHCWVDQMTRRMIRVLHQT